MVVLPLVIKEDTTQSTYTKHDQLHKELIQTFFEEFPEAFFPEVHDSIDFHTIKPLSEEVYTNVLKGRTRKLDIVMETKEETQLMKEVEKLPEAEKMLELPISYEEKGKEIGRREGLKKVAVEMLKEGLDVELIARVTDLDIKEIKEWRARIIIKRR